MTSCGVDPNDFLSNSSESESSDFSDDTEIFLESFASESDEEVQNDVIGREEYYLPVRSCESEERLCNPLSSTMDISIDEREMPFESLARESNSKVAGAQCKNQDAPERNSWRQKT